MGIIEIVMVVMGCVMLMRGKFHLGALHVEGQHAKRAGISLVAPLVIGLVFGFLVGFQRSRLSATTYLNLMTLVTFVEVISIIIGAIAAGYFIFNNNPLMEKTKVSQSNFAKDIPAVLTAYEAADYLRIPEAELLQFIDTGQIAAVKVRDGYRIARQTLDDFIAQK